MAEAKNFYAHYGVSVEFVYFVGNVQLNQALVAHEIDSGEESPDPVLAAVLKGIDLKIIGATIPGNPFGKRPSRWPGPCSASDGGGRRAAESPRPQGPRSSSPGRRGDHRDLPGRRGAVPAAEGPDLAIDEHGADAGDIAVLDRAQRI